MAIFKITHENKAVFDGEKFERIVRCEYQYSRAQIEASTYHVNVFAHNNSLAGCSTLKSALQFIYISACLISS